MRVAYIEKLRKVLYVGTYVKQRGTRAVGPQSSRHKTVSLRGAEFSILDRAFVSPPYRRRQAIPLAQPVTCRVKNKRSLYISAKYEPNQTALCIRQVLESNHLRIGALGDCASLEAVYFLSELGTELLFARHKL